MTSARRWLLPPDLLASVVDAASTSLDAPVAEVVAALRAWLPMGSTGKLTAIAQGVRPPGLDPAHVAATRLARWDLSWSCWAVSTLLASVLEAGGHQVRILALHRRDAAAVSFDLHSALVIDEAWLVDAYLGPTVLVPMAAGGSVADAAAGLTVAVEAGRVTDVDLLPAGHQPLAYRAVVDEVDAALLAGILDVSVTHTGVPFERYVQWATPDELIRVSERDGGGRWHRFALAPRAEGPAVEPGAEGAPGGLAEHRLRAGGPDADGPAPLVEERWGRFDELWADLAAHAGWSEPVRPRAGRARWR